jgi:hypothetical protein
MNKITTLQQDKNLWDLFTSEEEYHPQIRDQYDRFPYYASKYRNIFEPSASKYLVEHGYHAEYPEDKPFAVCLTHDIDILHKKIGMKTYEALGKIPSARFSTCLDYLAQMRSKKLPFWNFSDIMALEDHYDARSSFYFMVLNPGNRDYNYDIESCESIIGELSDNGWEVGLHGGHTTYNDPVEMKEKKQRLEKVMNKKVTGYRNHYLRFRVPDTFEYLQSAGFRYDSTLGYADCIGFRNGMCHPFKPYNLTTQREIDILEIPLHIMDDSLDRYMKLDAGKSWEMTKQLIDTVEMYHGTLTILWHNYSFIGEQRTLYEKILNYCREKDAWMTSGEQISTWWKNNAKD